MTVLTAGLGSTFVLTAGFGGGTSALVVVVVGPTRLLLLSELGPTVVLDQGDTAPPLVVTLLDGNGVPVPLKVTDQVQFHLRARGATADLVNAPAVQVKPGALAGDLACGQVRYAWQTTDTAAPGYYHAHFVVTYGAGGIQSFPEGRTVGIEVADPTAT